MYQAFLVLLHTKNDLPDAEYIHGRFTPGKYERIEVTVRKEHHSKKATKSNHCQKYWPKSCHEMHQQSKIAEEYQCHLPIVLNFTDELGENKIPACNHSSTVNIMDRNFYSDCSDSIPCVYTKYRQLKLIKSNLDMIVEYNEDKMKNVICRETTPLNRGKITKMAQNCHVP